MGKVEWGLRQFSNGAMLIGLAGLLLGALVYCS